MIQMYVDQQPLERIGAAVGRNAESVATRLCRLRRKGRAPSRAPNRTRNQPTLTESERQTNILFSQYRYNARTRGRSWELDRDAFADLIERPCHYCGEPPANRRGQFVYSGIDRVCNEYGYTLDNVVPCCRMCNHAKRDMSASDFLDWIARVSRFQGT